MRVLSCGMASVWQAGTKEGGSQRSSWCKWFNTKGQAHTSSLLAGLVARVFGAQINVETGSVCALDCHGAARVMQCGRWSTEYPTVLHCWLLPLHVLLYIYMYCTVVCMLRRAPSTHDAVWHTAPLHRPLYCTLGQSETDCRLPSERTHTAALW